MASVISKRQQARNERVLQDLIRSVPGNDRCADCSAKNPGWASWNLGIFLCMRCAGLHRKLGTHVSKVKSLSMDSWSAEQVDRMKAVGNVVSNKKFNPQGVRADIPVDIDEVDAALEKYIRAKYDTRTLGGPATGARQGPQHTGSTGTGGGYDDTPELPPKPTKRFGFTLRSTSSALPSKKHDRMTPPMSPMYTGSEQQPANPNKLHRKTSQLFGRKVPTVENNFNSKLEQLRDMGFDDNMKNTEMLKSMNGNMERTVEALTRLGEATRPFPKSRTPAPRALTPVSMRSTGTNGITVEKRTTGNNNPWEIREDVPAVPPRASSVPPVQTNTSASWNPFVNQSQPPQQAQPPQSLESSFDSLQVSQPNVAQSYGNQQAYNQNGLVQQAANPWQQPQQTQQQMLAFAQNNPFLQQQAQPQIMAPSNPWAQQALFQQPAPAVQQVYQQSGPTTQQSSNPWGDDWHQQSISQPQTATPQQVYGQQQDFFSQPLPAQAQTAPLPQTQFQSPQQTGSFPSTGQNPYQQHMQQAQQPSSQQQAQAQQFQQPQQQQQQYTYSQPQSQAQQQPQFPSFQQQQQPQYAPRHDKSSILALYNQPHLAPQRPLQTLPEDGIAQGQHDLPQRSATMPPSFPGSMNPFGAPAPAQTSQATVGRHVSNESVDFQGMPNGRHSPDAFAGLSARYMR